MSLDLAWLMKINADQNKMWRASHAAFPMKNFDVTKDRRHNTQECSCGVCKRTEELIEENLMDEDSPNAMLEPEEYIALFNRIKLKDENVTTDELIATRQLMKKAVAIIRAHVQAKTVILNDRRTKVSREEKEKIHKADKLYSPALRPAERAKPDEIKAMADINSDPVLKELISALPVAQRGAMLSIVKQLGIKQTRIMMKLDPGPEDSDSTPDTE